MVSSSSSSSEPKPKASNSSGFAAGLLVLVSALIWLVVATDRAVMPLMTLTGVERTVPDLRHLKLSAADSLCRKEGLDLVMGRTRIDQSLPPGSVLDQFPVPGSRVKPGKRIEVVVSDREGLVACPYLEGRSPREAMLLADSSGLKVIEEHLRYANTLEFPEGVVFSQNPRAAALVRPGSEITLTVSLGPAQSDLTIPDLNGRTLADAKLDLAQRGMIAGAVSFQVDAAVPAGTVLDQSPAPGNQSGAGGFVNLTVACESLPDSTQTSALPDSLEGK